MLQLYQSNSSSNKDSNNPALVILFMFFGLCSGILITQLLAWLGEPIPYSVAVFILGVISSLFSKIEDGVFSASVNAWVGIDADLIVFIFLPPLIFGEAMNMNWHHVKSVFFASSILAGPGVIIGAFLIGTFVKYVIPYNWSWSLSMCFGSMISATDAVAVIALLKSAGASQKLAMLISGESLLNDGTAMVLFIFFYRMLEGDTYTVGETIVFAISSIIGSTLLGVASGLVIVYWLRTASRPLKDADVYIQISITLCAAYMIFFLAQYVLRISGVLTCCAAGVMLGWLASPIILSRESMHSVWSIVEWIGNTLIFLLAGLIIGHRTLDNVSPIDWLFAFEIYIAVMVARFITVAVLYPWLKINGYRTTYSEATFLSWAGLRGALSVALALVIESNSNLEASSEETSRILFYVGFVVTLTLLINATTAGKLLDYLELVDDSTVEKELVMAAVKRRMRKKMKSVLSEVAQNFDASEIEEIKASCSLFKDLKQSQDIYEDPNGENFESNINPLALQSPRNSLILTQSLDETLHRLNSTENYSNTHHPSGIISPLATPPSVRNPSRNSGVFESNISPQSQGRSSSTNSIIEHVGLDFFRQRQKTQSTGSYLGPSVAKPATRAVTRNNSWGFQNYIFTNASSHSKHELIGTRLETVSRLLSCDRGVNPALSPDLLAYIRGIFLEIVRVKYWQHIDRGKLPRQSHSAQFLLYSVEVGLDEIRNENGFQDWQCIVEHVTNKSVLIRILEGLDSVLPRSIQCFGLITRTLGRLEALRDKRNFYILTSFIEGHEHAQKQMHSYVDEDDDNNDLDINRDSALSRGHEDMSSPTVEVPLQRRRQNSSHRNTSRLSPEETMIKIESERAVRDAKTLLQTIPAIIRHSMAKKQVTRTVLAREAEMVKSMLNEGLLTSKHAEEFLEEISKDVASIETQTNSLYREHASLNAKMFEDRKTFFSSKSESKYEPLITMDDDA